MSINCRLSNLVHRPKSDCIPSPLRKSQHRQIVELLNIAPLRHMHLDWQSLPALLADPLLRCWVIQDNEIVQALLGAAIHIPLSGPKVAWLRLALPPIDEHSPALDALWEALQADLAAEGVRQIGLLAVEPWIEHIVADWGFQLANTVVTLQRNTGPMPSPPTPPLLIRPVDSVDLDAVVRVDTASFHPLWQHSHDALETAQCQASTFTLIELAGDVLGYQLSTWYIDAGHLARLAVKPEVRGQGLGKLLVGDVLCFFAERNITKITVNTQADNIVSQRLYASLGFKPTGHSVSMWSLDL
ncbi:MAG: GNAT family N-acetyltransferase [Anaerolineae bacterium]|nr:GNAT family N-acetyltransferase [Anaerolineae bacterium]